MIETICGYPYHLVMGGASLIGALVYAGWSIVRKVKEEQKGFVFEWRLLLDTMWQSTAAGAVAGLAIGCSYGGLLIAMITGIGIDRIANKLKIKEKQVLNVIQLIVDKVDDLD